MNLYSNKQLWKISLLVVAALIVVASLWYNSRIVEKIRKEEQEKVKVWSAAVKKKANLVYITNKLFDQLKEEERKRIRHWAGATGVLAANQELPDYSFFLDILQDNTTIPTILTDESGDLVTYRNFDLAVAEIQAQIYAENSNASPVELDSLGKAAINDTIHELIILWSQENTPIEVAVYDDKKQYLYYTQSSLFRELKSKRDSLIASFTEELVDNSVSIPVIFTNATRDTVIATNIDELRGATGDLLSEALVEMRAANDSIEIELDQSNSGYIFHENSYVLTQLRYYPVIQFFIFGLFLFIAYLLFSMFRKAEQNQVWVGLAKETAHQLGTPLSSLMAWMELLEDKIDPSMLKELNKDVDRLKIITDRFSKIGSETELTPHIVYDVVNGVVTYLQKRSSRKVKWEVKVQEGEQVFALLNKPLFEWVIENLCKNAIDAMEGNGSISIQITQQGSSVFIDVSDTGKGIPASKFKTVFQPGYTTKKRGWGLGLSLVKRIVDSYHHGKIVVKTSEVGKGTTFRIQLKT